MKQVLFLAAVHGDEGFTVSILQELEQEFPQLIGWSWLVANEVALERGVRFIDTDMNRSAPGDPNSSQYEMRRVNEVLEIAKQYHIVIDLHGTTANSGIFVVLPHPTPHNIALAARLPISNVVIWTPRSSEKFGPLTRFVYCGVGIECGPKNSRSVQTKLKKILKTILTRGLVFDPSRRQSWFRVYGRVPRGASAVTKSLIDFQQTTLKGETFYPLLVGQYTDVICYKMEWIRVLTSPENRKGEE